MGTARKRLLWSVHYLTRPRYVYFVGVVSRFVCLDRQNRQVGAVFAVSFDYMLIYVDYSFH